MDKKAEARKRFKKLATHRTNEVLYRLKVLGNCANKSFYAYNDEDVNKIFSAIDEQLRFIKAKFKKPRSKVQL